MIYVTMIEGFSWIQLFAMVVTAGMAWLVLRQKPSRAQAMNLVFIFFTLFYLVGFYLEYTSTNLNSMIVAIKVEYVGLYGFMLGYLWFISEFTRVKIPSWIYTIQILITGVGLFGIFTIGTNTLMYDHIAMVRNNGHLEVSHTIGFIYVMTYVYFGTVYLAALSFCIRRVRKAYGIERRRYLFIIAGSIIPWIVVVVKSIKLFPGYDILTFGIVLMLLCYYQALIRYGYFSSVELAGENAIARTTEGIAVCDMNLKITFLNEKMKISFPELTVGTNLDQSTTFKDIFSGKIKATMVDGHVYDMRVEKLVEMGYVQGFMIWAIDMTEHYSNLDQMRTRAETDPLTGINNRNSFIERVEAFLDSQTTGALLMADVDNFKHVNDTYGHKIGDEVLIAFANTLTSIQIGNKIVCRLGGDEFCCFFPGITDEVILSNVAKSISRDFASRLYKEDLPRDLTISTGISICRQAQSKDFTSLYRETDDALYESKNKGKNTYAIHKERL